MIAIDKTLLRNAFLISGAKNLRNGDFISNEEFQMAKEKFATVKTHDNILLRVAFFLLGSFLYSSVIGAISVMAMSGIDENYEILLYVFAIVGFAGAEILSRMNFYNYGLEDAFILGAQGFLCAAVGINVMNGISVFATMAIIGLFCCLRYVHAISMLIALIGIVGFTCLLVIDFGIVAKFYLPFILFILAIGMYALYSYFIKNTQVSYFKLPLQVLQVFSLFLVYFSVNYLVVREASQQLLGIELSANEDIPFAFIFYILTFMIPLSYLIFSLYKKNRVLLFIGLLTLAFSIFTIRFYYSLLPAETALIFGGIILFALCYFVIRKLKYKEKGITYIRDRNTDTKTFIYAQAIISNSQNATGSPTSQASDMPFGGGDFSGGGAGGSY